MEVNRLKKQDEIEEELQDEQEEDNGEERKVEKLTQNLNRRRYLDYNHMGTIIYSPETNFIEIEFFDLQFHRKEIILNEHNFMMARMNYKGVVLVASGKNNPLILDNDGYLKEDVISTPVIYFKKFNDDGDNFEVTLRDVKSDIECLAIGNEWFAVCLDDGEVIIFSLCGIEWGRVQLNKMPLFMCAYEHILCMVTMETSEGMENNILTARIYNVDQKQYHADIQIHISAKSELVLIAFSEEGMLFTRDSRNIVRVYCAENESWITVYDNPQRCYIYGISEYKLEGVLLEDDEDEPKCGKHFPKIIPFKISTYHCFEQEEDDLLAQMQLMILKFQHETFRNKTFGHFSISRFEEDDVLNHYSSNIYDESKLYSLQQDITKVKVKLFKNIMANSMDKALDFFRLYLTSEQEMNQILGLVEAQKDKNSNKQLLKIIQQLKVIQKQTLLKQQRLKQPGLHLINKPQTEVKKGFGLTKQYTIAPKIQHQQTDYFANQSKLKVQPSEDNSQLHEEELKNPFAYSGQKEIPSVFEKRKPGQSFGSQNQKKL